MTVGHSLAVVGAGRMLSGSLSAPELLSVDTVIARDGMIAAIGRRSELDSQVLECDRILDANGATVAPGLIDSHCHVVLGDYTPRQKTVDFLASYVHGGITSCISPGEIHAPGRPHTATAVKGLAMAARECFREYRPGGMRVHAGAVIVEPTLTDADFAELASVGVHLAKFGFGNYRDPFDGVEQVRQAQHHGITVMCHSGGASIAGSQPITCDHLRALRPDVCGHLNGGTTSLDPDGVERIITETEMALQIVQAGNLRSALDIIAIALHSGQLHRIVLGSDTPTGTGVMPLGVVKTVAELSSLTEVDPATAWSLATGNCAQVWNLPSGRLEVGRQADLVIMDSPWGSRADDAVGALALGDLPGISAVVCGGEVAALTSRNTARASRQAVLSPPLAHLGDGH